MQYWLLYSVNQRGPMRCPGLSIESRSAGPVCGASVRHLSKALFVFGSLGPAGCATQMVHDDVMKHCAEQGKQAFFVSTEHQGVPLLIESAHAMYYCYSSDDVRRMPATFGMDVLDGSDLKGVGVVAVAPGSIADKAGIRTGDIIYEVSDLPVARSSDLRTAIDSSAKDTRVPIKLRRGKQQITATVQF